MPTDDLPSVTLISLGCPKNLVDSERMLAGLALAGFAVMPDADGADLAVVNTCGFIDLARAESDEHIDRLEDLKRAGRLGRIVVAGCMAQRLAREIARRHPDVDAVVGLSGRDRLAEVCRDLLAQPTVKRARGRRRRRRRRKERAECVVRVGDVPAAVPADRERLRLTPRHYAYLRITEGCDNRCAYCAIPDIRGPLRSKPPDEVLAEAEELVADGARELVLIGQDTTAYGRDVPDRGWSPAALLARLREQSGADWLRLMYTHPASFSPAVIEQLAEGLPLVPYVDVPLQHIRTPLLEAMGRRVTREAIETLLADLRGAAAEIAIRTSFIVGFPGETEADVASLVAFVRKVRFDHVGVFVYSPETGTAAAALPGQVPREAARERWDRVMQAAAEVAREKTRRRVGERLTVLVDGADADGRLLARHAGQAPEVDSAVLLPAGAAEPGEFVTVRAAGTEGYDLTAEPSEDMHP
ncbi:MAG: 30S ribosomal protein S12 methylthiotransferase RimO [Phycisphaerae bacterium]